MIRDAADTGNTWDRVNLVAQLADLKQSNYRHTLAISALIDMLVEKGVLAPSDFQEKATQLEKEDVRAAAMPPANRAPERSPHYPSSTASQFVDRS